MMSTMFCARRSVPGTLVLLLLAACASAPKISYYTLAMEPSGRLETNDSFVVERLQTTEALRRSQILIHTSPTRIEYYATDQWAGSLGELVQRKLAAELGPPVEGRRTLRVSGTILACEQVDLPGATGARMEIHIVVRDGSSKRYQEPMLEKIYTASSPAARASAAAVVEALSQCAENIAEEIASDASAL